MSTISRRLRFRFQGRAVVLLALIWVMLWGEFSLINILFGVALGWLITVVFWLSPIHYYGRVHPLRVVVLMATTLVDLAVASVQLTMVAFRPKVDLSPGIVRVDLLSDNDLYQVAVAELISIVPGTLVVETRRRPRAIYLHVFDLPDAGAVERERAHALSIERRFVEAFGSAAEIEQVQ